MRVVMSNERRTARGERGRGADRKGKREERPKDERHKVCTLRGMMLRQMGGGQTRGERTERGGKREEERQSDGRHIGKRE